MTSGGTDPLKGSIVFNAPSGYGSGRWCVRKKCRKNSACGYTHSCVSTTVAEAVENQKRWAAEEVRRQHERRLQEEADERHRLSLPTLDDKLMAIGHAVSALADLINGDEARLIASDLLETLDKETRDEN